MGLNQEKIEVTRPEAILEWLIYGWQFGVELGAVLALFVPAGFAMPFWQFANLELPVLKDASEYDSFWKRCDRFRIKSLRFIYPIIKPLQKFAYLIHEGIGYLALLPVWIMGIAMGIVGTLISTVPAFIGGGLLKIKPRKYQVWKDTFGNKCGIIYRFGERFVQFCAPPVVWVGATVLATLGLLTTAIVGPALKTFFSLKGWRGYLVSTIALCFISIETGLRTLYLSFKGDFSGAWKNIKGGIADIAKLGAIVLLSGFIGGEFKLNTHEMRPNGSNDHSFPSGSNHHRYE